MRVEPQHVVRRALLVGLALAAAGVPATVGAETRQNARVIILRSTEAGAAGLAPLIDAALVRALDRDAGFGDAQVSPIPLSDLGLAAGCEDRTRGCLTRIARTVEADVVVVRDLRQAGDGAVLALTSFDSVGAGAPIHAERNIEDPERAGEEVPGLVRQLYALRESGAPVAPSAATVVAAPMDGGAAAEDGAGVSAVTWVTLGAGAAALGSGVVLGVLAGQAHEDHASSPIRSDRDAERAAHLLDTAQDRALAANVLFGTAGALLGVGAALLVIDLSSSGRGDDRGLRLGATPSTDGAVVWLRGTTEEM